MRLISSARITLPKIGPLTNCIRRWPSLRLLENFRPGDIRRHQVGRELNALKLQMKHLRDRPHEQRLGQARCAGNQAVPARKQADQNLLDDFGLADDRLR